MILDELRQLEAGRKVQLIYFNYSAVFPAAILLAGANIPQNIGVNNDSDFLWRFTAMSAYSAPNIFAVNPDILLQYSDSGSGRNLQDQPVHISCITGTGQLPYILPEPYLITAGSNLTVTATNNAAGPAVLLTITLSGYKVFYINGYQRGV